MFPRSLEGVTCPNLLCLLKKWSKFKASKQPNRQNINYNHYPALTSCVFSPKQKHQKQNTILEVPGHHNLLHIFTVNLITSDPTVQTQLSSGWKGGTLGSVRWVVGSFIEVRCLIFWMGSPSYTVGTFRKMGGRQMFSSFFRWCMFTETWKIYIEISEWGFSKIKCSLSDSYPSRMSMFFDILGEQGLTVSEIILFQW